MFDKKTGSNILQWPVEEIEWLRSNSKEFHEVEVAPGSIVAIDVGRATQVKVFTSFYFLSYLCDALFQSIISTNATYQL